MKISAVYSVFAGGGMRTAPAVWGDTTPSFSERPVPYEHNVSLSQDRGCTMVVDVKGLEKRELDEGLLMNMRVPGDDIWYLTHIEYVDDVFDGFMGNANKIVMPYHTVRGPNTMRDILEISEDCIPFVMAAGGRAVCRGDQTKDLLGALRELMSAGFREYILFDRDVSLLKDDWIDLNERVHGIIPYTERTDDLEGIGFEKTVTDIRREV